MPDNNIQPLSNNISTGFDKQTLFDIDLDTSRRMDAILNVPTSQDTGVKPFSPMTNAVYSEPSQPKAQQDAHSLKDVPQGISLAEAMISDNPKLQDIASTAAAKKTANDPYYKYNLGATIDTPYDQGKKYANKQFGYDALVPDMEDYYYKNDYLREGGFKRSVLTNPLRFLGRVAGGAVAKLGEGLGYMGSLITSIPSDNYLQSVADNAFSKWFETKEQSFKDNIIPIYKQAGFDQKGFFSKLGDWSFWNDSVSDGVAFMASAALQTAATGGLGELAGLGELGAVGINTASRLGKVGKVLDFGIKTLTGAEDLGEISNWALNTASESAFEATGVFKETFQDLKDKRAAGDPLYTNKSDKELSGIAGKRAASDFKGNMLALSLSNAFENKFIFQPLKNKLRGATTVDIGNTKSTLNGFTDSIENSLEAKAKEYNYATKAGQFFNWKDPQSRLRFYGGRALASTAMEGLYEENVQLGMERLSRYGDYENKGTISNIWDTVKQSAKQAKDAYNSQDKEAAESIGLGALIGIGGTSIISKLTGGKGLQGERKAEMAHAQSLLDTYNTHRKEFLSFNDIYKKGEDGKPLIEDGNLVEDPLKVKAKADGLSAHLDKHITADQISNPVTKKLLQDDVFSDYIHAAAQAGILPTVINRFDSLQHKSAEEIKALGFNPAEVGDISDFQHSAKELAKIHEESFRSQTLKPKDVDYKDFVQAEELRKYSLYKAKSFQRAAQRAFRTVDDAINHENAENIPSAYSPDALDFDPLVQRNNSLILQQKSLEGFKDITEENSGFYKSYVEQRKTAIQKELDEIKTLLKDHIDSKALHQTDGFLFTPAKNKDFIKGNIAQENQRAHAGYTNAKEQWNYVSQQLSNFNEGHKNFQKYQQYHQKIDVKDSEQDQTTPLASEEKKPTDTQVPQTENKAPVPKQEPVTNATIVGEQSDFDKLKGKEPLQGKTTSTESTAEKSNPPSPITSNNSPTEKVIPTPESITKTQSNTLEENKPYLTVKGELRISTEGGSRQLVAGTEDFIKHLNSLTLQELQQFKVYIQNQLNEIPNRIKQAQGIDSSSYGGAGTTLKGVLETKKEFEETLKLINDKLSIPETVNEPIDETNYEENAPIKTDEPPAINILVSEEMKQQLYNLGYPQEQVETMPALIANGIIKNNLSLAITSTPEIETTVEGTLPTQEITNPEETANLSEEQIQNIDTLTSKGDSSVIDDKNPIASSTPAKTAQDQTIYKNLPPDQEILKDNPYDHMVAEFIAKEYFKGLSPVIIKDRPEWLGRLDEENQAKLRDNSDLLGAVIAFKKGDRFITAKELGLSSTKETENIPIVTSFNENSFDNKLSLRIQVKAKREESTEEAVSKFYDAVKETTKRVRAQIKSGDLTEVPITIEDSTSGIFPKATAASVKQRFGDFKAVVLVDNNIDKYSHKYEKGTVIADFGKGKFLPVYTDVISKITFKGQTISENVSSLLNHPFPTEEEAIKVKDYLKQIIYTTAEQGFVIQKQGEFYKITTEKDLSKTRLNVNSKLLTGNKSLIHYSIDPKGQLLSSPVSTEDYRSLIEGSLLTNFKKITDKDGNLHTEKVNPYFTFSLPLSPAYNDWSERLTKIASLTEKGKNILIDKVNTNPNLNSVEKLKLIEAIQNKPDKMEESNSNPFAGVEDNTEQLATEEKKQEALNTIKEGLTDVRNKTEEIISTINEFKSPQIEEDLDDYLDTAPIRDNPIIEDSAEKTEYCPPKI